MSFQELRRDWLRKDLENLLFRYWEELPEPKKCYTEWFYGDGGFQEMLNSHHLKDKKKKQQGPDWHCVEDKTKRNGLWFCKKCNKMALHRNGKCLYCQSKQTKHKTKGENQNGNQYC